MSIQRRGILIQATTLFAILISGCGDSQCEDAQNAFEVFTNSSVEARNQVNETFKLEKLVWESEKKQLIQQCETDFDSFSKTNVNVRSLVEFWGSRSSYEKSMGISICESAVGAPPFLAPSRFDFANSEFLNSQRVIINNQRCFAAEVVARAQMNLSGN